MRPVTLRWSEGEHDFALPISALKAVQDRTGRGPEELLNRLRLGTWHVEDLRAILSEGLAGAGMEAVEARRRVTGALEDGPLAPLKLVALAVMVHALIGPEDDAVGEPEGATPPPHPGVSPSSTASAP